MRVLNPETLPSPPKRLSKILPDIVPETTNDINNTKIYNLMNDPRVFRGNTVSAKVLAKTVKDTMALRLAKTTGSMNNRKQFSLNKTSPFNIKPSTPPPVEGRLHMNIQTEEYLEEIDDRPIEKDMETQTHFFIDRPPSPLFIPSKSGEDAETQIEPGELFNFDLEVYPILDVLVGKTLQTAMLELMQEEELEAIRNHQRRYEAIRDAELIEVRRLEAAQLRKQQERERRLADARKRFDDRKALNDKIASRKLAVALLEKVQENVFQQLTDEGFFYDPVEREIEEQYLPGLIQDLKSSLELYHATESLLCNLYDEILAEAAAEGASIIKIRVAEEMELERLEKEEEAAYLERKRVEQADEKAAMMNKEADESAVDNQENDDDDDNNA